MVERGLWCVVLVAACGGDQGEPIRIEGSARVLHGPKGTAATARANALPAAADGRWSLTPDKAKLTFHSLTFVGLDGQPFGAALTDCTPEYDRGSTALTELLACPFEIQAGTYSAIRISASTTYQMILDDATNGFFTNGTGVVSTSPGTPQYTTFTVAGAGGVGDRIDSATFFTEPLVVDAENPPSVQLLVDMIHGVGANVSGGTITIDTSMPALPAMIVPSVSGAGKTEFYSAEPTSANMLVGALGNSGTWGGARVFYANPPQPSFIFYSVAGPSEAFNVDPAKAPPNGTMFKAGGYLGVDSTNTMCWAMPANDFGYSTYARFCKMPLVSAGSSTTISCQESATAPAPTSGDTYASGCPAIAPTMTANVTLIAQ